MLAQALEAEVDADLAAHADQVDERGRRLVVRNGHAPARTLRWAGAVQVRRPGGDDRRTDPATGQRVRSVSAILPRLGAPLVEGRRGAAAAVPAPAVHRRLRPALAEFLCDRDYVGCWADGIHVTLRLTDGRLCALVIVGVRADGTKELVAGTAGTVRRPTTGSRCWVPCAAVGCAPRVVMSATAPWACGPRCVRSSRTPANNAAGSTRAIPAFAGEFGGKWPRPSPRSPTTPTAC